MRIFVGIDSGGSKTRALAVQEDGKVVGQAETGGGNPGHTSAFHENIQAAILGACGSSRLEDVAVVVSGIAGLDRAEDHEWADKATAVEGLRATRLQVNDCEVALFGALEGRPGIVSIQGEGSMVMGKTEDGRIVRNFDFFQYASASAVSIGLRATQMVILGDASETEPEFVKTVLQHWGACSILELRDLAYATWRRQSEHTLRNAGKLAPAVTAAAEAGSAIAAGVCDIAARAIVDGIRLVGTHFESAEVLVTLGGSCARSRPIATRVEAGLRRCLEREYTVVDPAFTPIQGAALWALQLGEVELTERVKARLTCPA